MIGTAEPSASWACFTRWFQGGAAVYPFDRFSENSKTVLTFAQEEAESMHHSHIGTEHLLVGMAREEDGLAGTTLKLMGLDVTTLRADVEKQLERAAPISI